MPVSQASTCGPTRRASRRSRTRAAIASGTRRAWRRTALGRSTNGPASRRCHHLEPVWRLMPAAALAAVMVQPERMRSTRSARPSGVRRALAWAIEGPLLRLWLRHRQSTIGALGPSTTCVGTRASGTIGRPMTDRPRFYLTTAIAYPNNKPGLHTLYEVVGADVIARWHRMHGYDTRFLTGTDEHSVNIHERAKELGKDTRVFVDE